MIRHVSDSATVYYRWHYDRGTYSLRVNTGRETLAFPEQAMPQIGRLHELADNYSSAQKALRAANGAIQSISSERYNRIEFPPEEKDRHAYIIKHDRAMYQRIEQATAPLRETIAQLENQMQELKESVENELNIRAYSRSFHFSEQRPPLCDPEQQSLVTHSEPH
jgi:hypothetical protein